MSVPAEFSRARSRPLRIAFVCDFGIVHARKYIYQFANRPNSYDVTVYSSTLAPAMAGVRLVPTVPSAASARSRLVGTVWEIVRRPIMRWPRGAAVIWSWSMLREAAGLLAFFEKADHLESPDIIHALRAQPEGLGAMALADRFPTVPFLVSLWGADLVLFGRFSHRMRSRTIEMLQRVNLVIADNIRDERLSREEFALPHSTPTFVMPAPGGLDIDELRVLTAPAGELPSLPGAPRILCSRGYESAYHRLKLMLQAFKKVLESTPSARLYVEVPRKPKRRAALDREIHALGLDDSVTVLHSTRAELHRLMQVCEIQAFATRYDGLSMSLLEGMYHGQLPVVFDHESYLPYLVPGENSVVFRELTVDAVAGALGEAITRAATWRQAHAAHWQSRLEQLSAQSVWFPRIAQRYEDVAPDRYFSS